MTELGPMVAPPDDSLDMPIYARLLEAMGVAAIGTDPTGRIIFWNRAASELYGWDSQEVLNRSVLEVTPSPDSSEQAKELLALLQQGQPWQGEFPVQRRDGSVFLAKVVNAPVTDDDGRLLGIIGLSSDITQQRRVEEELAGYACIVSSSADAIIGLDPQGTILSWNNGARDLFQYEADEVRGKSITILRGTGEIEQSGELVEKASQGDSIRSLELMSRRRDGTEFPVSVTVSPIIVPGRGVVGLSAIGRDISHQKKMAAELEWRAHHDSLTWLPNRSYFDLRLEQTLSRAKKNRLKPSVLLMDIDGLKAINDNLGHAAGDRVLFEFARRLEQLCGCENVARLGGDEFVAIVEQGGERAARKLAGSILGSLDKTFDYEGYELSVVASIGSGTHTPGITGKELMLRADLAMYAAKALAKGGYAPFEQRMQDEAMLKFELASGLKAALGRDEISVVFQPIVEAATGRIAGAETLIRWNHPTLGLVLPAQFITIAEDTGQIHEIGDFVLKSAVDTLKNLHIYDDSVFVTVNVSPLQFRHRDFAASVVNALKEGGVPPSCLVLEITETRLMTEMESCLESVSELRRAGIRVAIDDFGSGFSSISYLTQLPVDIVKTDPEQMTGAGSSEQQAAIVRAIRQLIMAANLDQIAEGIEDEQNFLLIRELGITYGQGFYLSRPMPPRELVALVSQRHRLPVCIESTWAA